MRLLQNAKLYSRGSIALALFCLGCANSIDKVNAFEPDAKEQAQLVTRGIHSEIVDTSGRVFLLRAPQRDIYMGDSPRSVFPSGFFMEIGDGSGTSRTRMQASSATLFSRPSLLRAEGSVKVLTGAGDTLSTEVLFWNPETKELYTHYPVDIYKHPGRHFRSLYLYSNSDFTDYSLSVLQGRFPFEE
jgi:hypothetical protein